MKLSGFLFLTLVLLINYSCEKKPSIPLVKTNAVSGITTAAAISGGEITDDGGAAIISKGVCWNVSDKPTIENNKLTESTSSPSFTSNLLNLAPNTFYYVRAYATNSAGTGYGESLSFKTLGDKPWSQANSASNITINSATLNGTVNSNLLSSTVVFEWGNSVNYGNIIPVVGSPFNGSTSSDISADLAGLTPGTTYHFRVKASNELGITNSPDMSFTTLGQVPAVITQSATNLQIGSATLNASVNPNHLSSTVVFEWGRTTSYGNSITPSQNTMSGNIAVITSAILTGLNPGVTYHYRLKATNELGTTNGADIAFTTPGQVPSVTTLDATEISTNSAKLNGSVNPNFLSATIMIEWGTDYGYGHTITATPGSLNGNTSVNVCAVLTGLTEGTRYCYRITATNELGTTNSIGFTFTTFAKPVVVSKNISEITTNSALISGSLISDFGSSVIESGICWSNSHIPDTSDYKALSSLVGASFSVPVTGLIPNSTYYLRAYAINSVGIGYGNELVLKTYSGTVSDIDGNQYYTVTVGSQIWMAQNLKTTKFQNGAFVGTTSPAQKDISGESNPEYQWPSGGVESNVSTYGRYYTWYAIMDTRNICPLHWHVPSNAEWGTMVSFLGGESVAGGKLKEAGVAHFASPNNGATNESGFTAIPAGYRNIYGGFWGITDSGQFWTSTEYDSADAWLLTVFSGSVYTGPSHFTKSWGTSVRCIKD